VTGVEGINLTDSWQETVQRGCNACNYRHLYSLNGCRDESTDQKDDQKQNTVESGQQHLPTCSQEQDPDPSKKPFVRKRLLAHPKAEDPLGKSSHVKHTWFGFLRKECPCCARRSAACNKCRIHGKPEQAHAYSGIKPIQPPNDSNGDNQKPP
jgi:hypothetical protein